MKVENYIKAHDAFVFELDHVLYPEKDFLLQVYYLFAQFIEYSEQQPAAELVQFMQETYSKEGHEGIFDKVAARFSIPETYRLNFDLLQRNVRLPLKLLLFDECLAFLQAIVLERKPIFLLLSGNPEAQLNKIRQMEWNGLEQYLTVYFSEELETAEEDRGLSYLINQHQLKDKNILFVVKKEDALLQYDGANINFLEVERLFLT